MLILEILVEPIEQEPQEVLEKEELLLSDPEQWERQDSDATTMQETNPGFELKQALLEAEHRMSYLETAAWRPSCDKNRKRGCLCSHLSRVSRRALREEVNDCVQHERERVKNMWKLNCGFASWNACR